MSNVETGDDNWGFADSKTYIDKDGWRQRAPVSDRECLRLCLHNSINLCGVNKEQVKKLYIKYGGKATI